MACKFDHRICELVNNPEYNFYRLFINGECLFDEFYEEVQHIRDDMKSMVAIINMMDRFSEHFQLPNTKFRHIENMNRSDVFEFKKKTIRVYIILQKPNVYIVMGGYKKEQNKDIRRLKQRLKGFPILQS